MNNTVNLSQLISRIAEATGCDVNTSRRFLRELFATVCECLEQGDSVTVPGIGTFSRADERFGHESGVEFVPDKTLAEEINRPFAMFDSIELSDDLDPSTLDPAPEAIEESDTAPAIPEPEPEATPVGAQHIAPAEQEPTSVPTPGPTPEPAGQEPTPAPTARPGYRFPEEEEEDETEAIEEERKPSYRWLWILIAAIIIGCIAGYFVATTIDIGSDAPETPATAPETAVAVAETAVPPVGMQYIAPAGQEPTSGQPEQTQPGQTQPEQPQPEQTRVADPAPEPVYETIGPRNYLSIIARRHYGVQNYWIFIYEANTDVLHDPDRIAPGTRVVVPPAESLPGADTDERKAIAARKIAALANARR